MTKATFTPGGTFFTVGWEDCTDSEHYEMELTREYVPDYARDEAEGRPQGEPEGTSD